MKEAFLNNDIARSYFLSSTTKKTFFDDFSEKNTEYELKLLKKIAYELFCLIVHSKDTKYNFKYVAFTLKINSKDYKKRIKDALLEIHNSNIVISQIQMRITYSIKFEKDSFELVFSKTFYENVIKRDFIIKFDFALFLSLQSASSQKLFVFFSGWKNKNEIYITKDELNKLLGLKYKTNYHFNEFIKSILTTLKSVDQHFLYFPKENHICFKRVA